MKNIPFPEMPRTHEITRRVPDHEILLRFLDDSGAAMFREWLDDRGWDDFTAWQQEDS